MVTLDQFLPYYLAAGMMLGVANGVWAFRDARRRGRSGILIAMLVLWTFPIGVILWLVFRPGIPASRWNVRPEDPDADLKERANAGLL